MPRRAPCALLDAARRDVDVVAVDARLIFMPFAAPRHARSVYRLRAAYSCRRFAAKTSPFYARYARIFRRASAMPLPLLRLMLPRAIS
jgi:hypothetical protein